MSIAKASILMITPEPPEPERQSGSRRLFHHAMQLRESGADLTVVSENLVHEQDRRRLQQAGIPVHPISDLTGLLSESWDLAIVAFWEFAEQWMPTIKESLGQIPIVVDSIDLAFIREAREHFESNLNGNPRSSSGVRDKTQRELEVYAAADLVLTVSDREKAIVNDMLGDPSLAETVPDAEDFPVTSQGFADRRGALFVGNFRHPPNGEALEYLCREIIPRVDDEVLASHPVTIVGSALDGQWRKLCRETPFVEPVGFVPSLIPYFANARVFVAPLLSGAGTKRKLIQALMVGVPAVVTSVAAEGLEVTDGEGVLIEDDPNSFAERVNLMLASAEEWDGIAHGGRAQILEAHGHEACRDRLYAALSRVI